MRKSLLKYAAVVLSGTLLLGGCGTGGKSQPEQSQPQEVKSEQAQTQTATEAKTDTAENTSGEAAADSVPEISITPGKKEWYSDDGKTLLLTVEESQVEVTNEGFDALKDAIAAQWGSLDEYSGGEQLGWAKEHYEINKSDGMDFTAYTFTRNIEVSRNEGNFISFCEKWSEQTGGAHGDYGVAGVTFDVKSGSKLELDDILSNPEGFYVKGVEYILKELDANYGDKLFPDYKETVQQHTFGKGYSVNWYLDDAGIVINYELYSLAAFSEGLQTVTLPYGEFAEYIKEEYIK